MCCALCCGAVPLRAFRTAETMQAGQDAPLCESHACKPAEASLGVFAYGLIMHEFPCLSLRPALRSYPSLLPLLAGGDSDALATSATAEPRPASAGATRYAGRRR